MLPAADHTYRLMGTEGTIYDAYNPKPCPGPGIDPNAITLDSLPDALALALRCATGSGARLVLGWSVLAVEAQYAFGFKVRAALRCAVLCCAVPRCATSHHAALRWDPSRRDSRSPRARERACARTRMHTPTHACPPTPRKQISALRCR